MKENIVLLGFGGHAKSVADTIERQGLYNIIGYTDFEEHLSNYKYLGTDKELNNIYKSGTYNAAICVGYLGKEIIRQRIYSKLKEIGFTLPVIIDPSAIISKNATVLEGAFVGKRAIINSESYIGKCCIINTGAIIEHEVIVGDFSHISVGTVLCGQVHIGKACFIGANSTVIQCLEIENNSVIPAGVVKRKNIIVFGAVIYQDAVEYIYDFIESVNQQSFDSFDVLLINDDIIDINIIKQIKSRVRSRKVIIKDKTVKKNTPTEMRVELLKEAKKLGYELLIIGDCDDTFSYNRVSRYAEVYKNNKNIDFYYNDLKLINGKNVIANLPDKLENIEALMQSNFVGMSNSAINLKLMEYEFIESLLEFHSFVFDWYLYSRMLLSGKKGMLVNDTSTIYRIYDNNFVGVNKSDIEALEKEIAVKEIQYSILSQYDKRYGYLYEKIKTLKFADIKINGNNRYWWSNIILER